jgi:dihydroorotate dehydrogenase
MPGAKSEARRKTFVLGTLCLVLRVYLIALSWQSTDCKVRSTKYQVPSTKHKAQSRFMVYRSLLRPILFRLPAETAHELALHSLSLLNPKPLNRLLRPRSSTAFGELKRFGLSFSNPVGLAAGFDKDGVALRSLSALGFGFIEAGTVTYHPQPGNPKPRLFRIPKDQALINRAGFNNAGAAAFARRVAENRPDCILGVSIGKSKIVPIEEATEDYLQSFELVYPVADYIAINVSSPNTPQLRELQRADQLESLLTNLQSRDQQLQKQYARTQRMPLLVKLSPDLEQKELELIVDVVGRLNIEGLIATNTTISRKGLQTQQARIRDIGDGGLSGLPLRERSTRVIATLFQLTKGRIPLIGVGGIFTADDAWEKVAAGASLLQLYTGLIYGGPAIANKINEGLVQIVRERGFRHLDEAVGYRAAEIGRQ